MECVGSSARSGASFPSQYLQQIKLTYPSVHPSEASLYRSKIVYYLETYLFLEQLEVFAETCDHDIYRLNAKGEEIPEVRINCPTSAYVLELDTLRTESNDRNTLILR